MEMLQLTGSSEGQLRDPERILVVAATTVDRAHVIAEHEHARAQLLLNETGMLMVRLADKQLLCSPSHAVYIPPGTLHEVHAAEAAEYYSVFIDETYASELGLSAGLLQLNSLVRELIRSAAGFAVDYVKGTPQARLTLVLYDQLKCLQPVSYSIPMPADQRLLTICRQLVADPADERTLSQWAKTSGASLRTLTRLFQRQTGLSFVQWRQHLRIARAIERLIDGEPVSVIALELGYRDVSAFTAMFRRVMGYSPSQYLRRSSD